MSALAEEAAAPAVRHRRPRRTTLAGLALVGTMILGALAAPLLPWDPEAVDLMARLEGPGAAHWLGTDHLGRDVLARLLHGASVSLGAVAVIVGLILALGIGVGGLSGLLGGRTDRIVMRVCDGFLTVPTFVLAMFMVGALGTGLANVMLAIALSHWAWYARLVRGMVLSLRERDYVAAAIVSGASRPRVFVEHILPGVLVQLVVLASLDIGHMILHVAGLSFLGLGVTPPTPEWGVMINDAREFIWTQPTLMLWPGLMILLTVMGFNLLGDALRDRLDPTLAGDDH
ncbi:nickel ABC transporter permease subunit NikC [Azospirillum agricola]|uniref:nickel ABC transporter permease subunit NikC n=1 Tax=Azospirillum agricola TaxID=1720247 RepID=UPI000A0EFA78|nr:nickel ABC transporter permease subunit NikC [Azospirillum agricola]SMH55064.1 nickel transport system permease protein [Azospirillum lipoferum]